MHRTVLARTAVCDNSTTTSAAPSNLHSFTSAAPQSRSPFGSGPAAGSQWWTPCRGPRTPPARVWVCLYQISPIVYVIYMIYIYHTYHTHVASISHGAVFSFEGPAAAVRRQGLGMPGVRRRMSQRQVHGDGASLRCGKVWPTVVLLGRRQVLLLGQGAHTGVIGVGCGG